MVLPVEERLGLPVAFDVGRDEGTALASCALGECWDPWGVELASVDVPGDTPLIVGAPTAA